MSDTTPFGSEKVITQHISEADLNTYFVGFDLEQYRWNPLIDKLLDAIVDFAFGYHDGVLESQYNREILREAAKAIYRIEDHDPSNPEHSKYENEDEFFEKKYGTRGEFGELILHLLLRDFHRTVCLVSKIYFKDADGMTVHGFDAVHIQEETKKLWLGESKLYKSGTRGIKKLVEDVREHFEKDYLRREFSLISKKRNSYSTPTDVPDKDKWFDLIDKNNTLENILNSVNIPLLCVYTSDVFNKHTTEKSEEFIKEYEEEMRKLKEDFDKESNGQIDTNLNVILLLFPVPDKDVLLKKMHEKLRHNQQI